MRRLAIIGAVIALTALPCQAAEEAPGMSEQEMFYLNSFNKMSMAMMVCPGFSDLEHISQVYAKLRDYADASSSLTAEQIQNMASAYVKAFYKRDKADNAALCLQTHELYATLVSALKKMGLLQ